MRREIFSASSLEDDLIVSRLGGYWVGWDVHEVKEEDALVRRFLEVSDNSWSSSRLSMRIQPTTSGFIHG